MAGVLAELATVLALAGGSTAEDPAYLLARRLASAGPRPAAGANERRAQQRVARAFTAAGLTVTRDPFAVPGKGRSRNVIGALPGRRDCLWIVMAHSDTVPPSPGAEDNASGIATLAALAPELATATPRCDLWLVATGAEERIYTGQPDHLGASALVRHLNQRHRTSDLRWALALDEVGTSRTMWLRSPRDRSFERRVVTAAAGTGLHVTWVADESTGNSDHREFGLAGLTAAKLGVRDNPVRHTAQDVKGRLRPGVFPRVRQLVANLVQTG